MYYAVQRYCYWNRNGAVIESVLFCKLYTFIFTQNRIVEIITLIYVN